MFKKYTPFLYIAVLCVLFGCGNGAKFKSRANQNIWPYYKDSILVTYANNPERALQLLDSAVALGSVDEFNEKMMRATIYSRSLVRQNQDSALFICEKLLQHDSVKNNLDNRESVLDLLINVSRAKANDVDYLRWSLQKVDVCRQLGEEVELLRTEAEIGLVMTHLGRVDEGLAKIDNSILQLNQPGSIDRMDAFIVASKRKINVLIELNRFGETIPLAQGVLDRLKHFEQHMAEYDEDSYRLKWNDNPGDRERYLDFYRAQANGYLALGFAMTGDEKTAHRYLTLFDDSNYGKSFSARRMIIPAQVALGMYDEAMNTCNQMVQSMGADTLNSNYALILKYMAQVAHDTNHPDEAFDLMSRYSKLNKALSDSLHNSQAHDYEARYHAKELQLKIQQARSESRQKTIVVIAIAILLLIAIIASFYFWRQKRHITRKNHALVRMINEGHLKIIEEEQTEDDTSDQSAADNQQKIENQKSATPIDAEMFDSIDATIRSERLYSNANLQRHDVCERFGISRVTLNNMLMQFRNNPSLPQYINSIRMEEAVKLLRENPGLSITYIAQYVGFSPANFRIQFINNYGMTPQEYRKNL